MASVRIPKPAREGLHKLASLSDEQFRDLCKALESIPLEIRHHSIFAEREVAPASISPSDMETIKTGFFPVLMAASSVPVPVSEYISDVVEAVEEEDGPLPDSSLLEDRLNQILTVPSTELVAKAYDVITEHGCTYASARILSDIRPVFGENVEEQPKAVVIVHMLNINYSESGDKKTFVVALDNKDIDDLSKLLERAKKKIDSLKLVIASTGITHIDVV